MRNSNETYHFILKKIMKYEQKCALEIQKGQSIPLLSFSKRKRTKMDLKTQKKVSVRGRRANML